MKVLSPDKAAIEAESGEGGPLYRARDGVFDVPDSVARRIVRAGGSYRATAFTHARGFVCECGFRALIRDRCGRCGATDLREE